MIDQKDGGNLNNVTYERSRTLTNKKGNIWNKNLMILKLTVKTKYQIFI